MFSDEIRRSEPDIILKFSALSFASFWISTSNSPMIRFFRSNEPFTNVYLSSSISNAKSLATNVHSAAVTGATFISNFFPSILVLSFSNSAVILRSLPLTAIVPAVDVLP